MPFHGIVEYNVPFDTVYVISETDALPVAQPTVSEHWTEEQQHNHSQHLITHSLSENLSINKIELKENTIPNTVTGQSDDQN